MGFVAGIASVAAVGTGIYYIMNKKTKKEFANVLDDTLDDANDKISKKINSLK